MKNNEIMKNLQCNFYFFNTISYLYINYQVPSIYLSHVKHSYMFFIRTPLKEELLRKQKYFEFIICNRLNFTLLHLCVKP